MANESLNEKAVSRKQQRFMGLVRKAQKTGQASSPEVAQAAASMSKSDVKDFASTKHKGLPEKKKIAEGKRDGKGAKSKGYSLRDWFKGGGWVQAGGKYDGKPCAKQPGQKTKPFCRDADDRAAMSKDERNRRAAKKRKEDPNPNRKGKAKMVREESCPICNCDPCQCLEGTIHEKKDACYHKVKARYSVWPSAYASGALVKCRKKGAKNWGNKTKKEGMSFSDFREISEARGTCWKGYKQVGMKKKGGKMVPNCVPEEVTNEAAAWTRKAGKNSEGGLNEKGRKSYERENPGSDLKRPSKKVGNPRRKSFCARMKGMKKKLTSKKTASDPDSRINKSLRAWNC